MENIFESLNWLIISGGPKVGNKHIKAVLVVNDIYLKFWEFNNIYGKPEAALNLILEIFNEFFIIYDEFEADPKLQVKIFHLI